MIARMTRCLIGVLVLAALGCGSKSDDGSKRELAQIATRKLALEAYPMWSLRPANEGRCPTASDLVEFGGTAQDPWGRPYTIECRDKRVVAISAGPDGKSGTADDVRGGE